MYNAKKAWKTNLKPSIRLEKADGNFSECSFFYGGFCTCFHKSAKEDLDYFKSKLDKIDG